MTASDGTGLALVSYDVDAMVLGPLAFTELRLVFENPQNRVIEGRFNLVLPDGAAVSRFAMKIDGKLQEAEVVEKQAARRAYEDALHRRQDPALLEQASPNAFSARVFPIPAKGRKEIVVSWSEEMAGRPWRLALVGLPEIGTFKARVRAGSQTLISVTKTKHVPGADLLVDSARGGATTLRGEDILVASVRPSGQRSPPLSLSPTLILLDTSASRALGEVGDRKLVTELAARWSNKQSSQPLVVVGFDQTTAVLHDGTFAVSTLAARKALGASDLGQALDEAAKIARSKGLQRVVLVSDGLVTAGLDGDELIAKVKALAAVGVRRLDAIAVGGLRDQDQLRRLVAGVLPEEGTVIDGSGSAVVDNAIAHLSQPAKSGLKVELSGATWVWPSTLNGVQPGDDVLIVAEIRSPTKAVLKIGDVVVDLGTAPVMAPSPLLRRAWARAKIARLLDARDREKNPAAKAELAEQIVKVSTTHRVLSPLTAMIVLETEADYARFGIARNALTEILTVNDAGLSLLKRGEIVVVKTPEPAKKPKPDTKDKLAMKKSASAEGEGEMMAKGAPAPGDSAESDDASSVESKASAAPAMEAAAPPPPPSPSMAPPRSRRMASEERRESSISSSSLSARDEDDDEAPRRHVDPYTGPFAEVMKLVASNRLDDALRRARGWREEDKGDLLALLALGEVFEKQNNVVDASRAYGSLIDLFSDRADIRRLAGARLDRVAAARGNASATDAAAVLAEDTWRRAATDRPDHPQGPRGQAWALVRLGRHEAAFTLIESTMKTIDLGRFSGVDEILKDDLALIGAAWAKASPSSSSSSSPSSSPSSSSSSGIQQRVKAAGAAWADKPSLRFVLWWETDANDVDFHIHDGKKNHAYYSQRELASGGRLYADITTGFGPECFTIEGTPKAFPYTLEAHYYSRGPMGFGMGAMRVVQHDGKGAIVVEDRPFVIMVDGAFVDLGKVLKPLQ